MYLGDAPLIQNRLVAAPLHARSTPLESIFGIEKYGKRIKKKDISPVYLLYTTTDPWPFVLPLVAKFFILFATSGWQVI